MPLAFSTITESFPHRLIFQQFFDTVANKVYFPFWLFLIVLQGCSDGSDKVWPSGHFNADPKKMQLEIIDSLVRSGEHRKALVLLDSFQRGEGDEIYLIQSEVLYDQALDSLYGE